MSVGFYLKDKNRTVSNITCVVSYKGKRFRRSTGESVPVKKWSTSAQRCLMSGYKLAEGINGKLNKLFTAAADACNTYVMRGYIPSEVEFWEEVDKNMSGGRKTPKMTFLDYFRQYIDRIQESRAKSTYNKYQTTLHKLEDFEERRGRQLRFEDIDLQFYQRFERYIYAQDYSANYFGSLIKCIKVVFREARDVDKLHDLDFVENKRFRVVSETADTIYLTEEELLRIHRLNITEALVREKLEMAESRSSDIKKKIDAMNIARAKFLIGAFTALRVSDFNRLDAVNLKKDFIRVKTHKTGASVTIPIHWVIRELLEAGFDITTTISDQKLNKQIKDVARLADIKELVEITQSKGGKRTTERVEKWTRISTHTARRSGATNMVRFGIPALNVMKITGHSKWQSFMKYVKISEDENAEQIKTSGFFDKPQEGNG